MNLTQLRYFRAVCRNGSITRSVEELKISQPSVSSAIRALEEEFGVPLFQRQPRGMVPTAEGERLLALADSLLDHVRQVEQVMHDVGDRRRTLRLGITPLIGSLVMPQLYTAFFRKHPDLRFHVQEEVQSELLTQLSTNRQDVVILPHVQPLDPSFRAIPIMEMRMACCLSLNHPLVHRRQLRLEEVKDEPMVLFPESSTQTQAVESRFAQLGIRPNILLYTKQLATVERFVSRNLAVGFLYGECVEYAPNMVGVPLDPPITAQISVVRKEGGYLFDEIQEFLNFCKEFSFTK